MEKVLARYYYLRRSFKRKIKNLKASLEEKEEWVNVSLQTIQLNDNLIRSYIAHFDNLRDLAAYKYELGKSVTEKQYKKKLDEANVVVKQIKTLEKSTRKLQKENKSLKSQLRSTLIQ